MDEFPIDDDNDAAPDVLSTDPGPAWSGSARGPRPPAEGVRIIGAEEAAAAIESGHVSPRVPDDAPRFGDVPEAPPGPQPPLRFPGSDPASVAKPAVVPAPPPPPPTPPPPPPDALTLPSFAPSTKAGEPLWTGSFDAEPLVRPDPNAAWDPPVVATAPPGRFEELVAAAAKAEAEAQARAQASSAPPPPPSPSPLSPAEAAPPAASPSLLLPPAAAAAAPEPQPEPELRQVTPDRPLTSDPISGEWAVASGLGGGVGSSRPGSLRAAPTLLGSDTGPGPATSDWDRLTGTASGRGQVSERGSWDFFDEPAEEPAAEAPAAEPPMSLPHWTEPATGEVPRILPGEDPNGPAPDAELSAWAALSTGPRWRDQPADWDEADFHDTVLDDRDARLGALRDQPEPGDDDIFAFDQPAAAAAPVPASGRTRGTATQVRAPARSRPARRDAAPRGGPPGRVPATTGGGPAGGAGRGGGGGGGGSDLSTRVVTGVIAVGVLLVAAEIGSRALVVLVLAAITMAAAELFQSLRARGYQPATLLGLVACAGLVEATYLKGEPAFPLILTLLVIFSFLWFLFGVVHAKPTMNIAVTVFAFVYVGFLGSFACLFLRVPDGQGIGWLLGAIIATAGHDIGAYLVGKYMGKTPLAPELSPNKTFEGLVGGVLASVFVSLIVVGRIHPWNAGRAFWLGVVVAVVAPLGDLCESMIKRDLGVKDMGKLLPGHGGVLDRVDALLFVIPATYYLTLLFH